MAIIFTTGTINQPDAGSVGLAMAEKIRDDVVAHAAWELVEEFTPSGGSVRWYVFKCLAAESGLPADFFVVMGRTLGNGRLEIALSEGYNTVGKVMSSVAPYGATAGVLYDSEGRHPTTTVLGTGIFSGNPGTPRSQFWIPSGTATKWWLTVAEDGFTVAFNGTSNGFIHVGTYVPLAVLPITMPLQICGNSFSLGAITRNPAVASGTVTQYALSFDFTVLNLGFATDLRYNDKLQSNQRPVAERAITIQMGQGPSQAADTGWALGKHKRFRAGGTAPAGLAFGDAYVLNGRLWVPYLPTDGLIWDTGVASS